MEISPLYRQLGKKNVKFEDRPLSNFDLEEWCAQLGIKIKGIYARNAVKPLHHSPCIINLDDLGAAGTHWVCCWTAKDGELDYFDSFGLPPPQEWEEEMVRAGKKTFLRNVKQIQEKTSVRCGYYCLLFLNERNQGRCYKSVLARFSSDLKENERAVKKYFT